MKTKKDPRDYSFPDQYERDKNTCKVIAYGAILFASSAAIYALIRLLK